MKRKTLTKSIKINAGKEKVWDVLINDKYTPIWYSEFSEGSHAETEDNWKVGSKVFFKEESGQGLSSVVIENKPNEVISIEHKGVFYDGKEDFGSEEAISWKGCKETYRIKGENGVSELFIEQEAPEKYYESFTGMWTDALNKIKELAEKN